MKKFISLTLVAFGISFGAYANTATVTIAPNTYTNLLSFGPNLGSATIVAISVASTTGSNTTVSLVDAPTNQLYFSWSAYTNRISYATNYNTTWTNYYGNVQTNSAPIVALIDVTNTVAAGSNAYPVRLTASAVASGTTLFTTHTYFTDGIWVTNSSLGTAAVTIQY
jgi:hypothetical protein